MEMEELESQVPPLSEGEVESDDEDRYGSASDDSDDEGDEDDSEDEGGEDDGEDERGKKEGDKDNSEDEGGADEADKDDGEAEGGEDDVDIIDPPPAARKRRGRKACPRDEMAERLKVAVEQYQEGMFVSIRQCALHHRVSHVTLSKLLKDPEAEYQGRGKVSTVFLKEEETALAAHITERMLQGCGLDIMQVRML